MAIGQQAPPRPRPPVPVAPVRKPVPQRPVPSRPRSVRLDLTLLFPGAVTLAVMVCGLTSPSYWRDETATLSADNRSIAQLLHMLAHVDVVHGWYYLLLWPVTHYVGTTAFDTRLPSAIAMALAAVGVTAIGRRVRSRRTGLYAGLVYATLPLVDLQGHDARPYAFETAAAVLASYLLLRAAEKPSAGRMAAYGLSLVNLGYMHLFGLLIIPAHAIALVPAAGLRHDHGPRTRVLISRWVAAVLAAGVLMVPVIWLGWQQRNLIGWLGPPSGSDVSQVAAWLAGGTMTSAVIFGVIALIGIARADWPDKFQRPGSRPAVMRKLRPVRAWARHRHRALSWLTVPWLVLPPAILLIASIFTPVYELMYVEFCLPAAALLVGAGIASIGWPVRFVALIAVVLATLPAQEYLRTPLAGGYIRSTAEFIAANKQPGDAIYYPGPPWCLALAYPQDFTGLWPIQAGQTATQVNQLYGTSLPLRVVEARLRHVNRLWLVEEGSTWQDPPFALQPAFRRVISWQRNQMWVQLWVRGRWHRPVPAHDITAGRDALALSSHAPAC